MIVKYIHKALTVLLTLLLFLGLSQFTSCQVNSTDSRLMASTKSKNKHRGAHVFGSIDSVNMLPLKEINIEWVTLVPFGAQENISSPHVINNRGDSLRMRKRNNRWLEKIKVAKEAGFKVFVKPHIWLTSPENGKWRSDIYPKNEADWQQWKKSYNHFIMRYARLAEEANAEIFCIGAELTKLSTEKPEYWKQLIADIRKIYSGQLTYAANWYEEYEQITFWDKLDYIGIQAYFPLTDSKLASTEEIEKGWDNHIAKLEEIHKKYNKQILFTELGYKSTADSAIKPWEWIDYMNDNSKQESQETQANCYEAFFEKVWQQNWFAGAHLWQWRTDHAENRRGKTHLDFTPQGKQAEQIIRDGFLGK